MRSRVCRGGVGVWQKGARASCSLSLSLCPLSPLQRTLSPFLCAAASARRRRCLHQHRRRRCCRRPRPPRCCRCRPRRSTRRRWRCTSPCGRRRGCRRSRRRARRPGRPAAASPFSVVLRVRVGGGGGSVVDDRAKRKARRRVREAAPKTRRRRRSESRSIDRSILSPPCLFPRLTFGTGSMIELLSGSAVDEGRTIEEVKRRSLRSFSSFFHYLVSCLAVCPTNNNDSVETAANFQLVDCVSNLYLCIRDLFALATHFVRIPLPAIICSPPPTQDCKSATQSSRCANWRPPGLPGLQAMAAPSERRAPHRWRR